MDNQSSIINKSIKYTNEEKKFETRVKLLLKIFPFFYFWHGNFGYFKGMFRLAFGNQFLFPKSKSIETVSREILFRNRCVCLIFLKRVFGKQKQFVFGLFFLYLLKVIVVIWWKNI